MAAIELLDERHLLLQIAEGSTDAFEIVYVHFYAQLKPLILKYSQSLSDTEEIIQETFIKVWLNRDKLPSITHFRGWLFKVASREYLQYVRKKLIYASNVEKSAASGSSGNPITPFESTRLAEIERLIQLAIQQMPPQRRLIYELNRNEGLKIIEIAERLDIAPQTVKNALNDAVKSIRLQLKTIGVMPMVLYVGVLLDY